MQFLTLHSWKLSPLEAVALQKELAGQVAPCDDFATPVTRVAGVDVSYRRNSKQFYAAVVVLDYNSMAMLEFATASGEVNFPYIPGLLSFRELPILLQAFRNLETVPDVILADAQGIAHPRRLGLASHLGLWLGLPTIGCAKSRLCGEHGEPGPKKGDWVPLRVDGVILGRVARTRNGVRPLYLSPGHKVGLQSATDMVLHCCRGYRLPEPTRQAHLLSNKTRQKHEARGETQASAP